MTSICCWTRANDANDNIKIALIVLCYLYIIRAAVCVCVCVCRVYPPTVVMGPPAEFLASRALGLCGLREEAVITQTHCHCLQSFSVQDGGQLPRLLQGTSILLDNSGLLWVDDSGGSHDDSSTFTWCRLYKKNKTKQNTS